MNMEKPKVNIIDCLKDPNLMGGLLRDPETWKGWFVLLEAFFGLPMDKASLELFKRYSGRLMEPQGPFRELVCICGRRSGKSRMAAFIGSFQAILFDYTKYLNVGERGVIQIIAADKAQAGVIFNYIKGILQAVPFFNQYIEREFTDRIDLTNNISIEVVACSYRSTRGRTVVCVICDEIAFWRVEGANPDREILAAVRPGMATIPNSKLIVISSPYAKFGVLYETYREYYGTDDQDILVWSAPTTAMNPTIDKKFIDKESKKDPAAAASEWYAEFRQDIETFINREALEAVINSGCYELGPVEGITYKAFCDPAGGSGKDSYALAIGHFDYKNKMRVLDLIRAVKPPFSPANVTREFSDILKSYRLHEVIGDRFGGEFPREAFLKNGINYRVAEKPKSDLYRDLLPLINSARVALLDNQRLQRELLGLERKVARSGRDSIDHGPRGNDDSANAVAGCLTSLVEGDPDFKIVAIRSKTADMYEAMRYYDD